MVLRIFVYLDKLIQITKPKKLVFLAIDGACAAHVCHASTQCVWGGGSCTPHRPRSAAVRVRPAGLTHLSGVSHAADCCKCCSSLPTLQCRSPTSLLSPCVCAPVSLCVSLVFL
jgi:hypothetical protein